jgi:hypothetical protein
MKMSLRRAMLLALMCTGLPYAADAADSTLVLVMGGEAYDGPPRFEVDFAGKPIGEGTVAAAIDTAEAGRFADQKDKTLTCRVSPSPSPKRPSSQMVP